MSRWIILLILTSLGRVPVVYNSFTVSTIEKDSFCSCYVIATSKLILLLSYFFNPLLSGNFYP